MLLYITQTLKPENRFLLFGIEKLEFFIKCFRESSLKNCKTRFLKHNVWICVVPIVSIIMKEEKMLIQWSMFETTRAFNSQLLVH